VERREQRGHCRNTRPRLQTAFWCTSHENLNSRPSSSNIAVPQGPRAHLQRVVCQQVRVNDFGGHRCPTLLYSCASGSPASARTPHARFSVLQNPTTVRSAVCHTHRSPAYIRSASELLAVQGRVPGVPPVAPILEPSMQRSRDTRQGSRGSPVHLRKGSRVQLRIPYSGSSRAE